MVVLRLKIDHSVVRIPSIGDSRRSQSANPIHTEHRPPICAVMVGSQGLQLAQMRQLRDEEFGLPFGFVVDLVS